MTPADIPPHLDRLQQQLASLTQEIVVQLDRGDFASAVPLYRQAMEVTRKALGEDHPRFAQSLDNLARMHLEMGGHAAALPLYRQALEIRRAALGENHPDFAQSLDN